MDLCYAGCIVPRKESYFLATRPPGLREWMGLQTRGDCINIAPYCVPQKNHQSGSCKTIHIENSRRARFRPFLIVAGKSEAEKRWRKSGSRLLLFAQQSHSCLSRLEHLLRRVSGYSPILTTGVTDGVVKFSRLLEGFSRQKFGTGKLSRSFFLDTKISH